jgi:hypothetical protein
MHSNEKDLSEYCKPRVVDASLEKGIRAHYQSSPNFIKAQKLTGPVQSVELLWIITMPTM